MLKQTFAQNLGDVNRVGSRRGFPNVLCTLHFLKLLGFDFLYNLHAFCVAVVRRTPKAQMCTLIAAGNLEDVSHELLVINRAIAVRVCSTEKTAASGRGEVEPVSPKGIDKRFVGHAWA